VLHCLEVLVIPELLINLQNLVSRSVRVQQWLEVTSSATNSPWRRASDLPWYTQEPLYMQWNQQNCMTLSLILYDANRRGNNNQLTWALFKYPGKRTFIHASVFQACLYLYVHDWYYFTMDPTCQTYLPSLYQEPSQLCCQLSVYWCTSLMAFILPAKVLHIRPQTKRTYKGHTSL
jgi:hypothetical protein